MNRICNCRVCQAPLPVEPRVCGRHSKKYGSLCLSSILTQTFRETTGDSSNASFRTNLDSQADDVNVGSEQLEFPNFEKIDSDSADTGQNEFTLISSPPTSTCSSPTPEWNSPFKLRECDSRSSSDLESSISAGYRSDEEEFSDTEDTDKDTDSDTLWSFCCDNQLYEEGIAVKHLEGINLSVLQWLALNFHFFTSHPSMSKSAFGDYLFVQRQFQCASELPSSYADARKLIQPFLLKKKVFDVCDNECIVYRDKTERAYSKLKACPVCDSTRYLSDNLRMSGSKRKFIYLPLGPRLARIYGDANLVQIIQSHGGSNQTTSDEMWDIHDSPSWKNLYSEDGLFEGNNMGLSLALELDGVNPFHNIGVMYSMTPMMISVLNWPRYMRNSFGNILLVGIIPANKRVESSSQDLYVEILVEELMYLSGCKSFRDYKNAPLDVKIKLLFYVLDYPGLSKLFGQLGSGSLMGCHWCMIRGMHCSHLDKVIYLSNRTFLKMNDPLRQDTKSFIFKTHEVLQQPKCRDQASEDLYRKAFQNAKNKTQAGIMASSTGCTGIKSLSALPEHDRIIGTQPDACHTIKDFVQNLTCLITGRNINKEKIVQAESFYGRLPDDHDINLPEDACPSGKKRKLSSKFDHLPYFLSAENMTVADRRASGIRLPLGFGTKSGPIFSKPGALKSHDWKQIATNGILKYSIRGMLAPQQRKTLYDVLDCLTEICFESQNLEDIDALEVNLNHALACLERDFPIHLQNITTHLLHHMVDGLRKFGPVYGTWMFVFERFNSWICKRALNMRYPEATVIETYLIYEWCQFMVSSGKLPVSVLPSERMHDNELDDHKKNVHCNEVGKIVDIIQENYSKRDRNLVYQVLGHKCSKVQESFNHAEVHAQTKQRTQYSCSRKETSHAKTISSFVFAEKRTGQKQNKVMSGKFVCFGRIACFLHCTCEKQITEYVAKVAWYENISFDTDSSLWYTFDKETNHTSLEVLSDISTPLVTAVDDEAIWFLNCGLLPYRKHLC